jgi:hypothetical protein
MITAASQPTERIGDQLPWRTDWTIALTAISIAVVPAAAYSHRALSFIEHPVL